MDYQVRKETATPFKISFIVIQRTFAQLTYRRYIFPAQRKSSLVHNNIGMKADKILRYI